MLHTKYQGSKPCGFRKDFFFQVLPVKACVNHVNTEEGTFLAQGVYLNKVERGLLGDTSYQNIMPL